MKRRWYDKKHPMRSGIMIASGLALAIAGTWMGMHMVARHHSSYMMDEDRESC